MLGHKERRSVGACGCGRAVGCGALVWVIDAQDDHAEAIARAEALLTNPLADDPRVLIAAGIRGDRLAAAERFLAACDRSGESRTP